MLGSGARLLQNLQLLKSITTEGIVCCVMLGYVPLVTSMLLSSSTETSVVRTSVPEKAYPEAQRRSKTIFAVESMRGNIVQAEDWLCLPRVTSFTVVVWFAIHFDASPRMLLDCHLCFRDLLCSHSRRSPRCFKRFSGSDILGL